MQLLRLHFGRGKTRLHAVLASELGGLGAGTVGRRRQQVGHDIDFDGRRRAVEYARAAKLMRFSRLAFSPVSLIILSICE